MEAATISFRNWPRSRNISGGGQMAIGENRCELVMLEAQKERERLPLPRDWQTLSSHPRFEYGYSSDNSAQRGQR
jgi:hypothetical protein